MANDEADLSALAASGDAEEKEFTVEQLIETGREAGVDISALAGLRREARRPQLVRLPAEVTNELQALEVILNDLQFIAATVREETEQWSFAKWPQRPEYQVPTETKATQTQSLEAGIVQEVQLDYSNTQHLVDVQVHVNDVAVIPSAAADSEWQTHHNKLMTFETNIPVFGKADIKVVWRNRDDTFKHIVDTTVKFSDPSRER